MPFQHIHQISEYLVGTDITLLELRGPQGVIRLVNDAWEHNEKPAPTDEILVASPGTGLFLHRHPLSQTALTAAGKVVEAGQVIGLLQVGVLLIPVTAPSAGQVAGHLVDDGVLVDFGRKLIALHPLTPQAAP